MPATFERLLIAGQVGAGARSVIASPFQFATDGTSMLRVRQWVFNGRGWGSEGPVFTLAVRSVRPTGEQTLTIQTLTPTTDVTVTTTLIPLEAGFLQTASVTWGAKTIALLPGPCYTILDLVQGTPTGAQIVIGQLLGGYVGPGHALSWPGMPIEDPYAGPGYPFTYSVATAAGNEITIPGATRLVWRLRAVGLNYNSDATVIDRRPRLFLTQNTIASRLWSAPATIPANQSVDITYMPGASLSAGGTDQDGVAPMPAGLFMRSVDTLKTSTLARQAGDQYGPTRLFVDVYIEPLP